jgi:L-cystine transport system permease protein
MQLFNPSLMVSFFPRIIAYIPVTLAVLFASVLASLVTGALFYILRAKNIPVLSRIVRVIMSFVRGTPVITQLFLIYFSLPVLLKSINIDITRVPGIYFVVFTYAMYFGAGVSENIRSSIAAVGRGQFEAAYSCGMTEWTAFRRIIFPQMLVAALPNFVNTFIGALKNTSLAFSVGVIEMMSMGQILGGTTKHYIEAYISISVIYYVMYLIIITIFNRLEKIAGRFTVKNV